MRRGKGGFLRRLAATLAVFALLFAGAVLLLNYISAATDGAQVEMVQSAVRDAVITCYAVEGCYPRDVEHLKENYGLSYDEERFYVYYDWFASNIMPEIRVSVRGAEEL